MARSKKKDIEDTIMCRNLCVVDVEGRQRIQLGTNLLKDGNPTVRLYDEKGCARAVLEVDAEGTRICVLRATGADALSVVLSKNECISIHIHNESGTATYAVRESPFGFTSQTTQKSN